MDTALGKLKESCAIKPTTNFDELSCGFHTVVGIKSLDTKFGKKIRAELEDAYIFLPGRINISKEQAEELHEFAIGGSGRLFMNYMGKSGDKKNSAILLDFEKMELDSTTKDAFDDDEPPSSQAR